MKFFACAIILASVLFSNAQDTNIPVHPLEEEEEESEQAVTNTTATNQTVLPENTSTISAETNATAKAPADPAKCVIARFSFDNTLQSEVASSSVALNFNRSSGAYAEGAAINENQPRFVKGKSGKALLLESAYGNFFSIAQSSASDANDFYPLQGTTLSAATEQPWQGKEALAVATKGENNEEGFSVEASVEQAFYTKEIYGGAPAIVPAYYVASLYLRGDGNLKIMLKDTASETCGEPAYVTLSPDWQRFHCVFGYKFKRLNIGAKHEADWKKSLPQGTNIEARLQLLCTTIDSSKMNFFADGLQLEQRHLASGNTAELSPHSWISGASQTAQEQLSLGLNAGSLSAWKKQGSIAFWFKPLWEVREGGAEIIWQITTNQMLLSHYGGKIMFAPAGVSFMPSDWKDNWRHVTITWNESGERMLYIDGFEYPNAAGALMPMKNPQRLMAGDFTRNLSPNGAFDELVLYSAALAPDQVKTLSTAEPAVKQPEAIPEKQSTEPAADTAPAAAEPTAQEADGENIEEDTEE